MLILVSTMRAAKVVGIDTEPKKIMVFAILDYFV
jgi:hypothetical protein